MDNRKTLGELKRNIADYFQIPLNSFLMKKDSKNGNEYKEMDAFLYEKFIAKSRVFLEKGTPSKNSEYSLNFSLGAFSKENCDTITYDFEELFSMNCSGFSKVIEIKEKICEEIKRKKGEILNENPVIPKENSNKNPLKNTNENPSKKLELLSQNPLKLRLRERNCDKMGQILHNSSLIRDYGLFDRKSLVIQLLDYEENTDNSDLLLVLKQWDLKKFELSNPFEIFVKKSLKLMDLSIKINEKNPENTDELQACKINNLWSFNRGDLLNENWVDLKGNQKKFIADPWFISRDGAFIV